MTSLKLALRFLSPHEKDSIFSSVGFITLLGVFIGVMTLILVFSVFLGFEKKLKSIILDSYPHVLLEKRYAGKTAPLHEYLKKSEYVSAWTQFNSYQGLISFNGRVKGVQLNGVDWTSFKEVVPFQKFVEGDFKEIKAGEILLGSELKEFLGVKQGDIVRYVYTHENGESSVEDLKIKSFFHVGRYEQDLKFCYVNQRWLSEKLNQAQFLAFGIKLKNPETVHDFVNDVDKEFLFAYQAQTWKDVDQNFLRSIVVERQMMFLILTIIIIVASFNIMSLLIIIAKRRTRDIAILRAMGATRKFILKVFLWIGVFICLIGVLSGVGGAYFVGEIMTRVSIIDLPKDVYQLSKLPIYIDHFFVLFVIIVSTVLCFLSVLIPSMAISRLKPAEGIHYE